MIKFFRTIRKKLIEQNKARNYFLYAIGEIILVVIGILLALQINTWSQMHKDSKEELVILEKLYNNIQTDTLNLNYWLTNIKTQLNDLKIITSEIKDQNLKQFSVDLYKPLLSVIFMDLETTTWQNLKSTGKISLLKNASLMDSLQTYYTRFDLVNKSWQEGFKSYNRNILAPKFFEFHDFKFFGQESDVLNDAIQHIMPYKYGEDVFFRNAIRYRIGATNKIKDLFEDDLARATHMLKMLSKEIALKNKPN